MEYSTLYDLIKYLEYGTKLHIGVLFLGNYGNEKCILPFSHEIHTGAACEKFKSKNFKRCFKCRNLAIKKALATKKSFGGLCINGIYEYTRPVIIDNEIACIIYIGNILEPEKGYLKISKNTDKSLLDTLEKDFDAKKCEEAGELIESYIRILLEKYSKNYSGKNPLIENIKSYINSNLEFNIEISRIAEIFHYNEKYLGRLFKKETNQTISNYTNTQRLLKAKTLLENTNDTIIGISSSAGFNNVTYFNRIFKKSFGITPSEYRTKIKN